MTSSLRYTTGTGARVRRGGERERAVGERAAVVRDAEGDGVIARVGGCRTPEQEAAAAVDEHAAGPATRLNVKSSSASVAVT